MNRMIYSILGDAMNNVTVGTVSPQLILVWCRWYAPLLTRSVNTQLALCGAWIGKLSCYKKFVERVCAEHLESRRRK
jgi:hypothetical protein